MEIKENVSLRPYNTFGFEAKARYFVAITSVGQLQQLLIDPRWAATPKWILGGGSNVLLTRDVDALVIRIEIKGIEIVHEDDDQVMLRVGAGENWHGFVQHCVEQGYGGVENLSLIPGTVGAAPMQNIGAYGVEIKDIFEELKAVETTTGILQTFDAETCAFGYRESVFKTTLKNQYIITSVTFRLQKKPVYNVSYGDIQKTLEEMDVSELSVRAISEAVVKIRQSKLPDPAQIGNAGSFFKNPEIPKAQFESLKTDFPTLPGYPVGKAMVKVPAGWLIEQAGWKGHRTGAVGVHDRQALVLVHHGGGTGQQIKELAAGVQASVEDKFGIRLTPEVNFV
ncbi:UDP-N-acetylmuramate dehydrogenase [Persicitalea jodogahamensis]|uniref:UDP-N-acetylenolpyruvoylglucosamine reductase n=1 Tax=Persicitalea jodogahamensis TaxID=402147 RepID=A0A8J3D606_9BACT|nr:UDP-N-acetylmuramate dehydrogenase [Persicitalea jodogahamensis]GHB52787.1 UDP-N-acetylenolpyruvoylglucosamine reductase [Persicitalea jodogahamensis]